MKKLVKWLCIPLMAVLCCQSAAAAGTLKETDVTPPQTVNQRSYPVSVIPHSDGSVDFFTHFMPRDKPAELRQFHSGDGGKNWSEVPCKWAVPAAKKYGQYDKSKILTEDITMQEDGSFLFAVLSTETDKLNHLIEAKPDGSFREIPMPVWQKDHEGIAVLNQQIGRDTMMFSYASMIGGAMIDVIDRKTGALKLSVTDEEQGWDAAFSGNTAVAGGMSDYFTFYDMSTGKRLRDVKLPHTSNSHASGEAAITIDETGAAYLASKYGIERLAKGGSVFETILPPDKSYLSDKTLDVRDFRKQPGADVFYIVLQIDGDFKVCRYAA